MVYRNIYKNWETMQRLIYDLPKAHEYNDHSVGFNAAVMQNVRKGTNQSEYSFFQTLVRELFYGEINLP